MRFVNDLNRFRQYLGRGRQSPRPPKFQSRLRLEQLEDRLVPSTLSVSAVGNASYTAFTGLSDNLTVSKKLTFFGTERILTDTTQNIFVSGPGASRWFGSGTKQVFTFQPVNSLSATFQNGNDIVNVQDIDYATALVTKNATVNVQVATAPLTISGAGALQVNVGQSSTGGLKSVTGPVAIANSVANATNLFIDDTGDNAPRTINVSNTAVNFVGLASFSFQANELSLLTVKGASVFPSNVWNVLGTSASNATVLISDQDGVSVQATTVRLVLQGFSAVTIGQSGSVQGIKGAVAVQSFNPVLTVDDSADPVGRNAVLSFNSLTGLAPAPITFGFNLDGLKVKGGTGSNVFTVASTPLVTSIFQNVLDLGTGSDKVTVLGDTSPLFIVAQNGTDTITVGGGTLANIHAFVSIANTLGKDHLIVDDSNDPSFRTFQLLTGDIESLAPLHVSIFYSNVSDLTITGGTHGDTFNVLNNLGGIPVTINGGLSPSENIVNGPNLANVWNITGVNAGQVGNVAFKNIQGLGGGNVSDTYKFANGAGVTSFIFDFAPGGVETLDYSAYTTPVTVDLKFPLQVAVWGPGPNQKTSVFDIERVIGGQGNNILVGDANTTLLQGGKGRDILISGGGFTTLQAGSGEAVLVGDHYLLDTDLNALNALMAEWARTDEGTAADPTGYLARVNHLVNGGGKNGAAVLKPFVTVVPDSGPPQKLITGAGLDFVFFDAFDIVPPKKTVNGVTEVFLNP
jgi:hypothetical protein